MRAGSFVVPAFMLTALLLGAVSIFAPRGLAPLSGVTGLSMVAHIVMAKRVGEFLRAPVTLCLAAGLLWMLTSSLWAIQPHDSLSTLHGLAPLLLTIAAVAFVVADLSVPLATRLQKPFFIGLALLTFFVILEWETQGLVTGYLVGANILLKPWELATTNRAIVLSSLCGWALAIMLWRNQHSLPAWLALAASGALTLCGILLTARFALLGGFLSFLAVLTFNRMGVRLVAVICIGLVLLMPWLPATLLAPEHFGPWLPELRFSGLHRLYIWQFAAERIAEHPVIGWGLDASRSMPGGQTIIPVPGSNGPSMPLHPHNGIMQVWVELGGVGAVIFAILLGLAFRAIERIEGGRFERGAALGALVTGLVFFSAAFGAWQAWWVGTMAIATAWVIVALRQPNSSSKG